MIKYSKIIFNPINFCLFLHSTILPGLKKNSLNVKNLFNRFIAIRKQIILILNFIMFSL
jgi:hypothetical protein